MATKKTRKERIPRVPKKPDERPAAEAPALVLRRYRVDEQQQSMLEFLVDAWLGQDQDLIREKPGLEILVRLAEAEDHVRATAPFLGPKTGPYDAVIEALANMRAVVGRDMIAAASQRIGEDGKKRRGPNADASRRHAIKSVMLAFSGVARHTWGLRLGTIDPADVPKLAGEFVAAVAYVDGFDRHGSWSSIKARYQQQARQLSATGKPAK